MKTVARYISTRRLAACIEFYFFAVVCEHDLARSDTVDLKHGTFICELLVCQVQFMALS